MRIITGLVLSVVAATAAPAAAQAPFTPARLVAGTAPPNPGPQVVGWVAEAVEVRVDEGGRAQFVEPLQAATGTSALATTVGSWTFKPALEKGAPVASHVFVAAIYRPPISINAPTAGTPPVKVGTPSSDVPAPVQTSAPEYPPNAAAEGVAVVEALVGSDGQVVSAIVVVSVAGLDDASIDAARHWTFAPAERGGQPVPAYVYLVFGFRRPVV